MSFVDTFLNIDVIMRVLPMLWRGIWNTLALAGATLTVGAIAGVLMCLIRLYAAKPFRLLAVAYIDVFRAIPILVLLVLIYYALPFMGLRFSPFVSAVLALSLVFSAFTAEVFRAGIQAIPKGQTEAAESLGLPFRIIIIKVILPQAFRIAIPPHTSNSVAIAKDTSLASVVAMPDLLKQATDAQALTANPSPLIAAALIYLIVLLPAVRLVSYLENRFRTN
ncbi:amino acid ABC transporter permease [Georhizobium profundi]|jgi:polar amino acid transport system permease protein|uniref:Amino acid ABC transporter permease n=1 Tax=Georhizobium profundi TaxID=2341112 RepID=A0A3Q8XN65_9HYPH|nr:amino acid ABC transporter permease [Georhizobium profundi]AZN70120.1 amino acid ABC transporter permease [Georhizobium profundi]GLQ39850.1 ABC transporter permease [Rhizobium albus]